MAAAVPKPVALDPEPEPMEEEAARVEEQEDPASASSGVAERLSSSETEAVATAEATTGATAPAEPAAPAAAAEPGAPATAAPVQKTRKDKGKGKGKGKGKKAAEEDEDGLLNRAEIAASLAEQKRRMQSLKADRPTPAPRDSVSAAEAKVAEEIRLLMGGAQEAEEEDAGIAAGEGADPQAPPSWAPPSGQTGDGRTSLNDKLGY